MLSVLSVLVGGLIASWAAAPAQGPADREATTPADRCPVQRSADDIPIAMRWGPKEAPTQLLAFLDPTDPTAHSAWLELRRLVGEYRGRLRVDVAIVGGSTVIQPKRDRVLRWFWAAAMAGRGEAALRLLARDGRDRVHARVLRREGRAALAKAIGAKPDRLARGLASRCPARHLRQTTEAFGAKLRQRGNVVYRLPVFVVDDIPFDDTSGLDALRPTLARHGLPAGSGTPPRVPEVEPQNPQMRRPKTGGLVLGGPGLRHRFVLMAKDEEDANLFLMLTPLLRFRRQHPGILSIHVTARGGLAAQRLRHRLCAARLRGRELDYLRYLASDPSMRRNPRAVDAKLLEVLDAVDESKCEDEADPAADGLPDGAWVDGIPRNRSELDSLATTLQALEGARRPLSGLLRPIERDD